MSAHPNALGLLDRAKRLIDESNPPDESPLTTASRDIREARAAIADLIEAAEWMSAYFHAESGVDRVIRLRNALARVGGGK